jgi:hypothetical protein
MVQRTNRMNSGETTQPRHREQIPRLQQSIWSIEVFALDFDQTYPALKTAAEKVK